MTLRLISVTCVIGNIRADHYLPSVIAVRGHAQEPALSALPWRKETDWLMVLFIVRKSRGLICSLHDLTAET